MARRIDGYGLGLEVLLQQARRTKQIVATVVR
jgi:hypothetical protein